MAKYDTDLGFSVIETLLILVVVGILGFTGWYVYHAKQTSNKDYSAAASSTVPTYKKKTSTNTTTTPSANTSSMYTGWHTYSSKLGGFTLKYPAGWSVVGFQSGNVVTGNQLNGNENEIYISEYSEATRENNLGVTVNLTTSEPAVTPYDTYPNGTTEKLSNELTLWQEKQSVNYATGPATDTCPMLNIGTDKSYSFQLGNGKYLAISGSYCWAQGMNTNYSYQQQLASSAWGNAVNIIKSVSFSE